MSNPYVGEIRYFPYNFVPVGWLACNGGLVSISEYGTLYALVGTTYGGDGVNTFGLPDLMGRVPIGNGQTDGIGQTYQIGQKIGTESVTLTTDQMPFHSHTVQASTATATATAPGGRVFAANDANALYTPSSGSTVAMAGTAVAVAGTGQPHDNRAPTLAITPCIATDGVFPGPA